LGPSFLTDAATRMPESVFFSLPPDSSMVTMMLAPMGVSGHFICRLLLIRCALDRCYQRERESEREREERRAERRREKSERARERGGGREGGRERNVCAYVAVA